MLREEFDIQAKQRQDQKFTAKQEKEMQRMQRELEFEKKKAEVQNKLMQELA